MPDHVDGLHCTSLTGVSNFDKRKKRKEKKRKEKKRMRQTFLQRTSFKGRQPFGEISAAILVLHALVSILEKMTCMKKQLKLLVSSRSETI